MGGVKGLDVEGWRVGGSEWRVGGWMFKGFRGIG